jgi:hypothetical protein
MFACAYGDVYSFQKYIVVYIHFNFVIYLPDSRYLLLLNCGFIKYLDVILFPAVVHLIKALSRHRKVGF